VGLTSGVIRSCDEGVSFDNVLAARVVFSVYATASKQVLAGGSGIIYYTNDWGQTWDSVALATVYPVVQIVENPAGDLFAITGALDIELGYVGDGVFYSADRGVNWTARNSGLGIYKSCERIAVDKNGRLYLGAADEYSTGAGGLFVSDNDGLFWEHVNICRHPHSGPAFRGRHQPGRFLFRRILQGRLRTALYGTESRQQKSRRNERERPGRMEIHPRAVPFVCIR
jgi:photosystem II stability/assembly factor-like uncharacterized protein